MSSSKPTDMHDHHARPGGCHPHLEHISDYVDGELSAELCRELEVHMEHCENCRIVVNTMAKTITLYHRLPAPEMPDAVRERLYKVLNLNDFGSKVNGSDQD